MPPGGVSQPLDPSPIRAGEGTPADQRKPGFLSFERDAQGSRGAREGLPLNALHLHMHAIAKMTAIAFTSH